MVDYSTGRGHYRPKPLIDIMSYKYNVFTGKLDYYESGSVGTNIYSETFDNTDLDGSGDIILTHNITLI